MTGNRLYRSPTDRVIAGVAGGLAEWMDIDPSLVRIAWVLLGIFSGGIFVLVYIVMMIVVPLPPPGWTPAPRAPWAPGSGWSTGDAPIPGGPAPDTAATGWTPPAAGEPGAQPGAPATGWHTAPDAWAPRRRGNANVGIFLGAGLVILGAWLLIRPYLDVDWDVVWPIAVIVIGGLFIAGALRRRA